MQQTDNYKLNLIEKGDTFSPDPLNDNTQKLDAALSAKFTALDAGSAALEERVTALEVHKVAVGRYTGNGTTQTIPLPFAPLAVIIGMTNVVGTSLTIKGHVSAGVTITNSGFTVTNSGQSMNTKDLIYVYCAIS